MCLVSITEEEFKSFVMGSLEFKMIFHLLALLGGRIFEHIHECPLVTAVFTKVFFFLYSFIDIMLKS